MGRLVALKNVYRMRISVFAADDAGQDVVEYGLMIASISIVVLLGTAAFGHEIAPWFNNLAARITTTGI
jgi:Flp pilus assembly pilin Flp